MRKVLRELALAPPARLLPINLDVLSVCARVLGVLPQLRALEPQLRQPISDFDLSLGQRLRRCTLALQHAHARYRATSSQRVSVAPLAAELARWRKQLFGQAFTLTLVGAIDSAVLARLGKQRGYHGW